MKAGILLIILITTTSENEHQPFNWTLSRWDDSKILKINITAGSPSFIVTNCELMGHKDCSPQNLRHFGWNFKATYWCPSSNPGLGYCNSPYDYYCAYWGCETISMAWKPVKEDKYLNVTWEPRGCNQPGYAQYGNVWKRGTCTSLKVSILQPQMRLVKYCPGLISKFLVNKRKGGIVISNWRKFPDPVS